MSEKEKNNDKEQWDASSLKNAVDRMEEKVEAQQQKTRIEMCAKNSDSICVWVFYRKTSLEVERWTETWPKNLYVPGESRVLFDF